MFMCCPLWQALHVAALCRSTLAAQALLDAGLPVDVKSRRGWTALEEALAAHDHATAKARGPGCGWGLRSGLHVQGCHWWFVPSAYSCIQANHLRLHVGSIWSQ